MSLKTDKKRPYGCHKLSDKLSDKPGGYLREIYQMTCIVEIVNLEHIRSHYFGSHCTVNPSLLLSVGPNIDWIPHHGRDKM